jgi:hypothetical protein
MLLMDGTVCIYRDATSLRSFFIAYLCFLLNYSVKSSSSDPFCSHYLCYCMELPVPHKLMSKRWLRGG